MDSVPRTRMLVDFRARFPTLLDASQLKAPPSSTVMVGMVSRPPLTTLLLGSSAPPGRTHSREGAGSPPDATHSRVIVSPGFTTRGSSRRSLIEGGAGGRRRGGGGPGRKGAGGGGRKRGGKRGGEGGGRRGGGKRGRRKKKRRGRRRKRKEQEDEEEEVEEEQEEEEEGTQPDNWPLIGRFPFDNRSVRGGRHAPHLGEEGLVDLHPGVRALRQRLVAPPPAVEHRRVGGGHAAQEHCALRVELLLGLAHTLTDSTETTEEEIRENMKMMMEI
ncbi:hypothetical protein EYF80_002581 [Liparis tanakae]|uniref:Uncharacterized protein n=1 Tax=Liparis tanakae TaxID=230148 RepID=A0A4Z2JB85_9TELE|nr:hypothetical protein EYF80_002581 [Liparis tanakae]